MATEMTNGGLLYHEVQESKLCAVHCVNTLLQAPVFSEFDLANIASDLDTQEHQMLLQSQQEESSNVSMDGNFSIQVLEKALSVWDLQVIPLESPLAEEATRDPQNEEGFICHLQDHWFSIRKVDGEWYNFNSLYPAPEHLSKFYLAAYLDTLKGSGWSIFLVRGKFPKNVNFEGNGFGQWLTPDDAQRITKSTALNSSQAKNQSQQSMSATQGGDSLSDTSHFDDDAQLRAAIAASLGHTKDSSSAMSFYEDKDLMAAIEASLSAACPTESIKSDSSNAMPASPNILPQENRAVLETANPVSPSPDQTNTVSEAVESESTVPGNSDSSNITQQAVAMATSLANIQVPPPQGGST